MLVELVCSPHGWFVVYTLSNKEVDRAGPFEEEWEALEVQERA